MVSFDNPSKYFKYYGKFLIIGSDEDEHTLSKHQWISIFVGNIWDFKALEGFSDIFVETMNIDLWIN